MQFVIHSYNSAHESSNKLNMKEYLEQVLTNDLGKIEAEMCESYDWDVDEYYKEIRIREERNDLEVINMLHTIDNAIKKAVSGEKPVVTFKISPELTKPVTLTLYKWIMLSNAYIKHKDIHYTVENSSSVMLKRKQDLVNRFNIPINQRKSYAITLQSAYFTYYTNDEEFERKAKEMVSLNKVLNTLLSAGAMIPEFEQDPFELSKEGIEVFYDTMINEYVKLPDRDESQKEDDNDSEYDNEYIHNDEQDNNEQDNNEDRNIAILYANIENNKSEDEKNKKKINEESSKIEEKNDKLEEGTHIDGINDKKEKIEETGTNENEINSN